MTKVDQFESIFRAATREIFRYEPIAIRSVLVVTDREAEQAQAFGDEVRRFAKVLGEDESIQWRDLAGEPYRSAGELLELIGAEKPDLICTYRNLYSNAWQWPYSLGTHLDLMTQHTSVPVLVLPHPEAGRASAHALEDTSAVMAVTDHLTGDARLVNYAVRFTQAGGTLWLTHVEDEITFARYLDAVAKIPAIDTEIAREALREQMLKDPREYIGSCREVLAAAGLPITVAPIVTFGHHLAEYRRLIAEHRVDLLVMNTKDEDQLAMHGLAYELAVELRQAPVLML